VNAKPFLGYDGKQAVEQWLTILKSEGKYDPDKPMLEIGEHELSETLKRLTQRANVSVGNQNVRFHQLRVFLITRLSKVLETNRWKQIVGKTVPESSYVKPFELKEDYEKVLPLITVNTTASLPRSQELEKLRKHVLELQGENVELRKIAMKLAQDLEDVKARARSIIEFLAKEMDYEA